MNAISKKKKISLLFLTGMLMFISHGNAMSFAKNQTETTSYPISPDVVTTLKRTLLPDSLKPGTKKIKIYEVARYDKFGYGKWHYGPGTAVVKRYDLMEKGYSNKTSGTNTAKLLSFFTITDIHITDKESPAQAIYYGYSKENISAYSPVMLYSTHVLDAAIQTINSIHNKHPFDFGISLGDNCNNNQYNELKWFIQVMDGQRLIPHSGTTKDPIPGPHNDYQDEYKAAGLNKSIPWYQAIGNHDHFWMGVKPPNDYIRKTLEGDTILTMGNIFTPDGYNRRDYYMGTIDGSTRYGDVVGAGDVASTPSPNKIASDSTRHSLSIGEWMNEFFNTTSKPKGHGFKLADVAKGFACYSFEPKADLPLKVIVLDDTQRNDDPEGGIYGHSSLDMERFNWLVKELDKGQAEGRLMIIAAHCPIGISTPDHEWWSKNASISENTLIDKLHTYPNLILWIAGHRHQNIATAFPSSDPSRPELGFWEVETASLREFPQEFRTFDIIRNNDNTISIIAINVDPAVRKGSPAATSRSYAVASSQILKLKGSEPCNAELFKQLTPAMQKKIQHLGKPIEK
jgi:metallophosphoesterase (TIGR03768 family)